jgi:helix-turn-helix protein
VEAAYCSIDDFALRVGVCRNTVKKWLKHGLPAVKLGKVWRIRIEHADVWLLAGAVASTPPKRKVQRTKRPTPVLSPSNPEE